MSDDMAPLRFDARQALPVATRPMVLPSVAAAAAAAAPAPAEFGKLAIAFAGGASADYFSNENSQSPPPPIASDEATFCGWIKPTDVSGRKQINSWWYSTGSLGAFLELNGNVLRLILDGGGGITSSAATVAAGVWVFVGASWLTAGSAKFYIGVYDPTGSTPLTIETNIIAAYTPTWSGFGRYAIGGVNLGIDRFLGSMCEMGYWQNQQTDLIMQEAYAGGAGLTAANFSVAAKADLMTWHPMNDLAAPLIDTSGGQSDLQVVTPTVFGFPVYGVPGPNA